MFHVKTQMGKSFAPGKKADGSYRPCGDYRKLNSITTRLTFSIPHLFDFVNNLKGSKIFSKIDLQKAYYHVPMTAESRYKTSITTPFDNFCFNITPFGLCGVPSTFMRLMSEVVQGLTNIFTYLDDVIVFGSSAEDHKMHLSTLSLPASCKVWIKSQQREMSLRSRRIGFPWTSYYKGRFSTSL